jgi:hypothetical protein
MTPGTDDFLADPAHHADVLERVAALHRIGTPMSSKYRLHLNWRADPVSAATPAGRS